MEPHDRTRNRLLVSVPSTGDPNFEQTVVYMIDHDDDGAIGVVLNRPHAEVPPEGLGLGVPVASPHVLFEGGPVSPDALIMLGRRRLGTEARGIAEIGGVIAVLTASAVEDHDVAGVDVVRVFAGYSGWGPRQLEAEMSAGVWVLAEAMPDDVFCAEPAQLWQRVLSRRGGRWAAMARFPDDPRVN